MIKKWAEQRNKEAYKKFGDVITFDIIYLTNKYNISFALFVEVNHYSYSILFEC